MTLRARAILACLLALLAPAVLVTADALANCGGPYEPPISQQDTLGGGNDAAPPVTENQCNAGEPVNCATGNQYEEQTDLVVGGRGPALHLTRTYNSQAAAEAEEPGPWGYGWSGPYSSHLEFDKETGAITVVQENGATATFELEEGEYVPGAWVQATLEGEGEGYVFTLPDQEKLKFDSEGRLTEQEDRNGNSLSMSYESGNLTAVDDDAERKLEFTYFEGKIFAAKDPMGNSILYGSVFSDELTLVRFWEGGEAEPETLWEFEYDESHQMTKMTDGRSGVTKTEYDEENRVKKQTDPMERVLEFEYGESEELRTTTITEPNESTTFQKFNKAGEPLEVIKAKGTGLERKSTFEYDEAYRLVKATDALSHSTTFEYDEDGNRTLDKDAKGNERKWTYNSTHDVMTATTPRGNKTTYERDANGNIEAIKRPAPGEATQEATFKYAENGDLESATDPLENKTTFEYDSYGNVKAETDPEVNTTTWTYDENGRRLTEVSPRGNEEGAEASEFQTTINRDARGRPVLVTDPLGRKTEYAYDGSSNLEAVTDANENTTSYTYNANDERTEVEAANEDTTKIAYDSMGAVKSRTDANGNTTTYEHDALGQLTEEKDPLERTTSYEYDDGGNLEKTEDQVERTTAFSYDEADRLTEIDYSEEATADVTYEYDKDGHVVKMTDGTGTTTREYDQLSRLTEVENGNEEVVKYAYNLGDQQTEIVYPNGEPVEREFDKAGRMKAVTDWLGNETTFEYNADSQINATVFPEETANVDEYAFNPAGELSEISMNRGEEVLASMSYTRDGIGQIETIKEAGFPEVPEYEHEYDAKDRLTKSNGTTFGYDKANNVTKISSTTYEYDKADQIEAASNASFEFNGLGQRVKETPEGEEATTFSYDQAGNLIEIESPGVENTFEYDGTGLKATETKNTSTYPMVWDSTAGLPLLLRGGQDYFIYGPDGLPIEQITAGNEMFFHHDHLGSTRVLTGTSGEVVGTYRYGPNGAFWKHTGEKGTLMGFAGQYRMHTGNQMIYMRARTYDPVTAQFLTRDPLTAVSGETYAYAAANPVNVTDPTGLTPDGCSCPPLPCPDDLAPGPPEQLPEIVVTGQADPDLFRDFLPPPDWWDIGTSALQDGLIGFAVGGPAGALIGAGKGALGAYARQFGENALYRSGNGDLVPILRFATGVADLGGALGAVKGYGPKVLAELGPSLRSPVIGSRVTAPLVSDVIPPGFGTRSRR